MSFELRTGAFSAFVDRLTPTTHVMIVLSDPSVESAAAMMNLASARKYFENIDKFDLTEPGEKVNGKAVRG
jgi:Ras-related GTP-binding protein A/B